MIFRFKLVPTAYFCVLLIFNISTLWGEISCSLRLLFYANGLWTSPLFIPGSASSRTWCCDRIQLWKSLHSVVGGSGSTRWEYAYHLTLGMPQTPLIAFYSFVYLWSSDCNAFSTKLFLNEITHHPVLMLYSLWSRWNIVQVLHPC